MMHFDFFNEWHLGDHVFHIDFMRKLSKLKGDTFSYYVNDVYIQELTLHLQGFENVINLYPIALKPSTAIHAWIGVIYFQHHNKHAYNEFYIDWFNFLTTRMYNERLNIDIVSDYEGYNKPTPKYDILFINSEPKSRQFDYNAPLISFYIQQLATKYKIVTTSPVNGVPSTNCSLVEIGAISQNVEHIVAVNTAPIVPCFNYVTLNRVKHFIIGDLHNYYTFDKCIQVRSTIEMINEISKIF